MLLSLLLLTWGDWETYISMDNTFSVRVPCQLLERDEEILLDVGKMKVHNCYCKPGENDPNLHYMINYVDYPKGTFHKDSTQLIAQFMKTTIDETAFQLEGSIDYQSQLESNEHMATLVRFSYDDKQKICKSLFYLVEDRFYAIQVHCNKNNSLNDDMDVFLNSFRLLNKKN